MNMLDAVRSALLGWPAPVASGSTVIVPTHCLYPSNGIVNVYVEGGRELFLVHDDGGAFDQLHSVGGYEAAPMSIIRNAVRRKGLGVSDSRAIFAKDIPLDGLAGAIALVANGSQDAAHHLVNRLRPLARRTLTEEVETILDLKFPSRWKREEAHVGASNKQHRFDYAVSLKNDVKLLMDIVKPEASSINAAVVAHLDVRNAHPTGLVHRVIYDDRDNWSSENLSLLGVGATPIPVSVANQVLERLAA
jgi:hypothetical protein